MSQNNPHKRTARLGIEILEARTVPATFGAAQGESIAVGDVIPSFTGYEYVTGSGPGVPSLVQVFDAKGTMRYQFDPFPGFTGGVYVAVGEVTSETGSPQIIESDDIPGATYDPNTGAVTITTQLPHGYSVGQTVQIAGVSPDFDGIFTITALEADSAAPITFDYVLEHGLNIAGASGGTAAVFQKDIIVSTAPGTVGQVKVYSFRGNSLQQVASFTPFGPTFTGGVQITTGNVTGNHTKELIVGQETGGSVVKVYAVDPASQGSTFFKIRRTQVFGDSYIGGITIAAANIDKTENTAANPYNFDYAEIIVGRAINNSRIKILDAQQPTITTRASYFAFDPNIVPSALGGVDVYAGNTDGVRGAEIYITLNNSTTVRVFDGQTGVPLGDFDVDYPVTFGRNLNLAINDLANEIAPGSWVHSNEFLFTDLYVVAADGPYRQIPIVFRGKLNSPAGFNGSRAAP